MNIVDALDHQARRQAQAGAVDRAFVAAGERDEGLVGGVAVGGEGERGFGRLSVYAT